MTQPASAPQGAPILGDVQPVVVVLEPEPYVRGIGWRAYVVPEGEAVALADLAEHTLVGWKAVHILPIHTAEEARA